MYIYILYIYVFHYSIAKLPIPPSHPPAGHCSAKSSNSLRFFRRSASAKAARRRGAGGVAAETPLRTLGEATARSTGRVWK